jgi:AAA+ ATPase superfamily predicted ATPase
MFVGRKEELQLLEKNYHTPGGHFILLYGQHRIGKTELLHQFAADKPHVFYSCREISDTKQRDAFAVQILDLDYTTSKYGTIFSNWDDAFLEILEFGTKDTKKLLIIDEFPHMCKTNPTIPAILQNLWEEKLKHENIMIILSGSEIRFRRQKLLKENAPLILCATDICQIKELSFYDIISFFPNYAAADLILTYAILGGTPYYLKQFDPTLSLHENIIQNVLTKGCILYNEVEYHIRQEIREPALYNTVMEAIASGHNKLNEICAASQLDNAKISVYLKNLSELQILVRRISVLSSTKGRYYITNHYFRFWYCFVFSNLSDLEANNTTRVFQNIILPKLNRFTAPVFETVCCEYLHRLNYQHALPFFIEHIGNWWDKQKSNNNIIETEIDIVAVDARKSHYLLGECNFKNIEMELAALERLRTASNTFNQSMTITYMLFSKSGFSPELVHLAQIKDNLMLFTLTDIIRNN